MNFIRSLKTKCVLVVIILLTTITPTKAQNLACVSATAQCATNTGVALTPTNSCNMATLLPGATDPRWTVQTIPYTGTATGGSCKVVSTAQSYSFNCLGWSNPASNTQAAWITPSWFGCSSPTVVPSYSCITNPPVTDLYYRLSFNLTIPFLYINWQLMASDWVQDICVNSNIPIYTTPAFNPPNYPNHRQVPISFQWCSNWKVGLNQITVHVKMNPSQANACKVGGLWVQSWSGCQPLSLSLQGPQFLCSGASGQYTAATQAAYGIPANVPTAYSWSIPSFWTGPNSNTYLKTVTPGSSASAGIISVAVTTMAPTGSVCVSTAAFSVTVPPPLTITPSSATLCSGKSLTLTASGAVNYTWSGPGLFTPNYTSNPVVVTNYPAGGQVQYNLTGSGTGCTYNKSLIVNVFPTPNVVASVNQPSICAGSQTTLQVQGTAWQYFLSGPGISPPNWQIFPSPAQILIPGPTTIFPVSCTPPAPIVRMYTVLAKSIPGCTNTANFNVTVKPLPSVAAAANPSVICACNASTLTASCATTYSWLTGLGVGASKTVTPCSSTIYTVQGTNQGCVNTATVKVATIVSPVITVNPPNICAGITNTLSASGAMNYTWYVAGQTPSVITSVSSLTINSSSPISYTVNGATATNSCVGHTSGIVPMGTLIPITAPNQILCTNGNSTVALTATSTVVSATFTWMPTSPVLVGPTVAVSSPGIYTVSASSTFTGCPNTTTMSVLTATNCCPQSTIGMTQLTGPLAGTYANGHYVLSNPVTIGPNATFLSSEVWMTQNAKITVPAGYVLDLNNAHFFACGDMWDGIKVSDGGRIVTSFVTTSITMIEDAKVAIELDGITAAAINTTVPAIDISRIIFNRNYIGIKISNSDQYVTSLPLGINGCVFTSRDLPYTKFPNLTLTLPNNDYANSNPGALRFPTAPTAGLFGPYGYMAGNYAPANLKGPYSSQPASIGIQIQNIGDPNALLTSPGVEFGLTYSLSSPPNNNPNDFNLFEGIGIGIDVTDASLTTNNNVFQNIISYPVAGGSFGGTGVRHTINTTTMMNARCDLRISSNPSNTLANQFWDCITGVDVQNAYECWVSGSVFRSSHQAFNGTPLMPIQTNQGDIGVKYESNRFSFTVENCQFNNVRKGIVFSTPVTTNNYNMYGTVQSGIFAQGFEISGNYFGPETQSGIPYAPPGSSNNSEYMSEAIEISTPNTVGWATGNCYGTCNFIISNKINRVFRGISIDGLEDMGTVVSTNSILVEQDITYPLFQKFGISVQNNRGNMVVLTNSVDVTTDWNTIQTTNPTASVAALYFSNNNGAQSPSVQCNQEQNALYGFQFDGKSPDTYWAGNQMCINYAGLALTNSAVIGPQGDPSWSNNNAWASPAFCGFAFNGSFPSANATYCENSIPSLSPIYVRTNGFWEFPSPNSSSPNIPGNYYDFGGPSPSLFAAAASTVDCIPGLVFPAPPWWRGANSVGLADNVSFEDRISIYPNPTNDNVIISGGKEHERLFVRVFDLSGHLVLEKKDAMGESVEVNVSQLAASIYVMEVSTLDRKTIRLKLVKTD
jgi:hypothetical protein